MRHLNLIILIFFLCWWKGPEWLFPSAAVGSEMQAHRASRWWRVLDLSHSADVIKHVCSSKTDLFFVYGTELLSLAFKWRTWSAVARCSLCYCVKFWVWNSALKGLYREVSANIWELGWLWRVFNRSCLLAPYLWFSDVAKLERRESGVDVKVDWTSRWQVRTAPWTQPCS